MAPTPSVKVIKHTAYRGGVKEWSNRYHFNGGTPADDTHWHTLMDAIVNAEKACLLDIHTIVECVGYGAGSDLPVASKTYTTAGTISSSGANIPPLDVAGLLRWDTTARTSKNHPIYLFSYFHGPAIATGSDKELLGTGQKTAYETYGAAWVTGFSDGSLTCVRAGPNGATGSNPSAHQFVTHRDFRN